MKRIPIGKFTQTKLTKLPFRKQGEGKVGYVGDDRRILAVPNLKRTTIVVAMNHSGKRHHKTVGNLCDNSWKDLEKRASNLIGMIVNEAFKTCSTVTVLQFYTDVVLPFSKKNHKDKKGLEQRLRAFIAVHGDDYVCDITKLNIIQLLNSLSDDRSSPTIARYLAGISKFMSLAVDYEIIDINPCVGIKKPKENPSRKRCCSDAEIFHFFKTAINDENPIHGHCLALCAVTGQRQGNIRSIETKWFNKDLTVLHIPDSKSGNPIDVQLSPVATDIIKLALPHSDGKYLFPSRIPGKFMSKPTKCMARIRRVVQKETGITEHFYAHDLRRTFATMQLRVTGDLNIVRENLAHADVKTTLIYALNQNDKLLDANTKTSEALLGGHSLSSFIKQPLEVKL